jgi:hypothetical protein
MRLYDTHVLPRLTHLAMRQEQLRPYRGRVISAASGRVLEIGIGSGLNLPFYRDAVERVIGVDPSPGLLRLAPSESPSIWPKWFVTWAKQITRRWRACGEGVERLRNDRAGARYACR